MDLKEFRKNKNLTQTDMAKIMQLNQQAYSRLENSESILSIKNALKLSQHFHISLDEIYGITQEEHTAGISATTTETITPLEDDLLTIFREIGENLGEAAQRAFLTIGESIAKNSQ